MRCNCSTTCTRTSCSRYRGVFMFSSLFCKLGLALCKQRNPAVIVTRTDKLPDEGNGLRLGRELAHIVPAILVVLDALDRGKIYPVDHALFRNRGHDGV